MPASDIAAEGREGRGWLGSGRRRGGGQLPDRAADLRVPLHARWLCTDR